MPHARPPRRIPRVTERQWQVAELVALGYPNQHIADELGLSLPGVKYHVSELLHRLALSRREEVADWYRAERLVRGEAVATAVFSPRTPPPPLVALTEAQGWPPDLLRRAMELQVAFEQIERWLARSATTAEVDRWLDDHERLMFGTIRVRQATWLDNEALADLYASAAEPEGEWAVTVERGPHAFAQSRLQERFHVQVVEDRGVILGAVARAYPRVRIAGVLRAMEFQASFVVRSEARGWGVSRLISHVPRPASAWPAAGSFYVLRAGNAGGHAWLRAKGRAAAILAEGEPTDAVVPGVPVTAHHLSGAPAMDATGIRPLCDDDLEACARLIERTRDGFDFVEPVTAHTLRERLAAGSAAERAEFWPHVYGRDDFFVVEHGGRIVACAGLWDAGRDHRQVWRHPKHGRKVVESTMVLDAGVEPGHEADLVRLLAYLGGLTDALGRDRMTAMLEPLPDVLARLDGFQVSTETRSLQFSLDERTDRHLPTVRPFLDLAYW